MTVEELESRVIFQTNNDEDDLDDYLPYLCDYLNEAYDQLLFALSGEHLEADAYLKLDSDTPELIPIWAHPALADFATWRIYRNSNPTKQQRGMQFLQSFNLIKAQVQESALRGVQFYNMD